MYKGVKVEKICSFCVSNWHLITMLMPYLGEKIDKENIVTFLEEDMSKIIEEFLNKLSYDNSIKEKILKLNWNNTSCKYADIKLKLETNIEIEKQNNIIIFGSKNYIQKINENIKKWIEKGNIQINIKIIDAYEVMQFNDNLNDILDEHDKILNTAGEKEISEVFEGYEKKTVC